MAGIHTLIETERKVSILTKEMKIDYKAMAVISNLFRSASAVKNHLERSVLAKHGLSWTGFVVMWVVWIWDSMETREIAAEVGTSKATLTGVMKTLEKNGLIIRQQSKVDRRLVIVSLTGKGKKLMLNLFPEFNEQEVFLTSSLKSGELKPTSDSLRIITKTARGKN